MGNAGGSNPVTAPGSSLAAGRELSELKPWVLAAGWEAGAAQQSKTCGEALQSVGREVKSFNWNKAGQKTLCSREYK